MGLKEAINCIKRNKSFLITCHTSPEADALGSELAFLRLVKSLGKNAVIINEDKTPAEYEFFPGIKNIQKLGKHARNIKFDCFVTLDCSDLTRCPEAAKLNLQNKPVLNIDHHISNTYFADVNWVDPNASCCAEMLLRLYKKLNLKLNRDTALLLYAGLLMDTGSFRYGNTTAFTHRAAAELLRYKIDTAQVYKNLYENIPFEDMKLLCKILPAMRSEAQGRIIWFQVKRDLLKNKKISFDLTEHVLGFGRAVKDAEVAVLFKENLKAKDEIRVNLRSQGKIDVNKIANFFGGGGHKGASGCTVKGKIEQVRRRVLRKIKEALRRNENNIRIK